MKQDLITAYLKACHEKRDIRYPHMAELLDTDSLSTDKCKVLYAYIGLDIRCENYGKLIGAFVYKDWSDLERNPVIEFVFHIHVPNQGKASLSNRMQSVEHVSMIYGENGKPVFFTNNRQFGTLADKHIPEKYLTDDDLALYRLTRKLRQYSQKHNCCNILRKTDKKRLQYVADISATECVCEHTDSILLRKSR